MNIKSFSKRSLWRQFLIASFPIFLVSTLVIGTWVSNKIENDVAHRRGSVTALIRISSLRAFDLAIQMG